MQRLAAEYPHFGEHLVAYGKTFAALECSGHLGTAPFPYGDQRTRHAHLLQAAVAEPRVRGLEPWLDMLRSKFGRVTPPHRRVLADINRTFLELQHALSLSRSIPPGHAVQVGCDYQRRGAGFDMQVHDASGQLHTQVEVTSVAQPVYCRLQLHNAVAHVEKKAPRNGRHGNHWGAIGLTWAAHASPARVVEDLVQDLNDPHPRLAGASLRLDGISLFAAHSTEHGDLARIRKEHGHWLAPKVQTAD